MRRLLTIEPDLRRLLAATLFFGAAGGIYVAILGNYLAEVHHLDARGRGWLEFPRELPGFLILFVSAALLTRMRESRMAVLAMGSTALGGLGLALLAPDHAWLVVWIIAFSMGEHIIFAVEGPLGLKLARSGSEGKRLGHLGGARNLGTITGAGAVFLVTLAVGKRYDIYFVIAAVFAATAGWFYFRLRVGDGEPPSRRLVVRREYGIFYAISALFGIRKQIFLVFGTWVLVKLHGVQVGTMVGIYLAASTAGIVLRPLMGEVIDWLGERIVLAADEVALLLVCLVYAFASHVLPEPIDLWVLYGAYVLDHLLFALRAARTTYIKKIAVDPADITPSISLGITIDHVVAMTLPILSGYLWTSYGHEWVFLLAGAIAVVGFFVCLKIRVPETASSTTRGESADRMPPQNTGAG